MKAVILAGGKGTRLKPYTTILPKPLMPIGDMPILEILLRQMRRAGVDEAVLTVGHLAELLRLFFQDGQRLGLTIRYSYEDAPLGTAGPLSLVEGLDDTFLVANGDVLTTLPLDEVMAHHRRSGATATIAMHRRRSTSISASSSKTRPATSPATSRSRPTTLWLAWASTSSSRACWSSSLATPTSTSPTW
jgi:NDP-sugar pyrophosphorylase family protein